MDRPLDRHARHVDQHHAGVSSKVPPPEAPKIAMAAYPNFERMEMRRQVHRALVNKVPDATLEGRLTRNTGVIFSRPPPRPRNLRELELVMVQRSGGVALGLHAGRSDLGRASGRTRRCPG